MIKKSTKEQRAILKWLGYNVNMTSGKDMAWKYPSEGITGTYQNAVDRILGELHARILDRTLGFRDIDIKLSNKSYDKFDLNIRS